MTDHTSDDAIRLSVTVPAPADRAFAVFAERMGEWWPRAYTWSGDATDRVLIEPWVGGAWYERTADGYEEPWGEVLGWDPPRAVTLSWQITHDRDYEPDLEKASEVEVRFVSVGPSSTRVELEHRAFARYGAGVADAYRAGLASPDGWPKILAAYAGAFASG